MSVDERFWIKVNKTDTCWLWTAAIQKGYGKFRTPDRMVPAHRFAYESLIGPVPEGLQLDHLCRVRHCVNPAHLEPVTARTNTLRSTSLSARNAQKTHCPQGHPYSGDNLIINSKGQRICRLCQRQAGRKWQLANRITGVGKGGHWKAMTHCKWGHPFDEVNTKILATGYRACRECKRIANREAKRAKRAAAKADVGAPSGR